MRGAPPWATREFMGRVGRNRAKSNKSTLTVFAQLLQTREDAIVGLKLQNQPNNAFNTRLTPTLNVRFLIRIRPLGVDRSQSTDSLSPAVN